MFTISLSKIVQNLLQSSAAWKSGRTGRSLHKALPRTVQWKYTATSEDRFVPIPWNLKKSQKAHQKKSGEEWGYHIIRNQQKSSEIIRDSSIEKGETERNRTGGGHISDNQAWFRGRFRQVCVSQRLQVDSGIFRHAPATCWLAWQVARTRSAAAPLIFAGHSSRTFAQSCQHQRAKYRLPWQRPKFVHSHKVEHTDYCTKG